MAQNNRLSELRQQVAKAEQNAARKIARIKRNTDAIVAGTQFDPRKEAGRINTMRTRDLEAYARRLAGFTNRKTQFVAGHRGAPLPVFGKFGWRDYKGSEVAVKTKFETDLTPFANEPLPGPGTETIGQRQGKIRSKHPTAMNMGYVPPERLPFNVKDAEALVKLTKSNKKRLTQKWAKDEHKRAQDEFSKMVGVFNDPTLSAAVGSLSYGQFDMIWNLTRFADAMSLGYHHIKAKMDRKQEVPESVIQDQVEEAKSIIDWVKKFNI